MLTLYGYCAAIGIALLVGQFLLSLAGLGDHGDFDGGHDLDLHGDSADGGDVHHDGWYVGLLSFRSVVTALAIFGLVGLGLDRRFAGDKPAATFATALAAGGGMLYAVGKLLRGLHVLRSDGTVAIEQSIGLTGTAYLSIPANRSGFGKITVELGNRTMEFAACTAGEAIPTGSKVLILSVAGAGTVEVAVATTAQATYSEGNLHA